MCFALGVLSAVNHEYVFFFTRMSISSPGTQKFPGNSLFQLFLKISPISSHSRKKGVILGEGQKLSSPGGPCTTLSTSIRFFQASGQSLSVIFTPHSSSGRAECECLSYVHRFQLIFHLFMPSLVLSCSPPSNYFMLRGKSAIQRYKVQSRTRAATAVRCCVSV